MLRGTAGQSCIRRIPSRLRRQAALSQRTALLPTLRAPCETASVDEAREAVKEGHGEARSHSGLGIVHLETEMCLLLLDVVDLLQEYGSEQLYPSPGIGYPARWEEGYD